MKTHAIIPQILTLLLLVLAPWATAAPLNKTQIAAQAWAAKTPVAATKSVAALATHISSLSQDEYTRALMAFDWMCLNISYDWESFRGITDSGAFAPQDADAVLRSRKGVCAGYANLYKAICEAMGLETEVVSGYAKGYGFDQNLGILMPNHAWNAVRIYGQWQLVDVCWGDKEKTDFIDLYYFCASPRQFTAHHLPADAKWQLQRQPMTYADYVQRPIVWDGFHHMAFEGYAPITGLIQSKPLTIKLKHAWASEMQFYISFQPEGTSEYHSIPITITPTESGVQIALTPPNEDGRLHVYAGPDASGAAHAILTYTIQANPVAAL